MKIFVTGASGYLGASAVRSLQARGHQVDGLARSAASAERLRAIGVTPILGSVEELDVLARAATTADGVVHAAFNYDDWSKLDVAFEAESAAVDAMLLALEGSNKPFVYTSGAGTLGDTGATPVDETFVPGPDPWVQVRRDIEKRVLDVAQKGVRSVVIRPGLVYGRGGSGIVKLLLKLGRDAGVGRTFGTGENAWSVVYVDDVGELYALAVERAPAGSVLHAAAGDPVRMSAIAAAISRTLGKGDRTESIPMAEARATYPFADSLASEKQISAVRTGRLLDWTPKGPSIVEEIERGPYANFLRGARAEA